MESTVSSGPNTRRSAPVPRDPARGLFDGIFWTALVLVVLQWQHQLRFGWLDTFEWWGALTAGQVLYVLIRRYRRTKS